MRAHEQRSLTILKIRGPGEFIGLMSCFYGNIYQNSASAIEDAEILHIKIEVIKDIIAANGNYALRIMNEMSKEGLGLIDNMVNRTNKQIPGRIAGVLLFFATEVYKSNIFQLPLSRQELAELVSTTKETVSRTLTEFRNDRIIEIKDKKIEIKSLDLVTMLNNIG